MQSEESMDLKQSNGVNGDDDTYIPNSKSTDLIKPSKSGNLDNQQPSGERKFLTRKYLQSQHNCQARDDEKNISNNIHKLLRNYYCCVYKDPGLG